jgi:hypothetical protein
MQYAIIVYETEQDFKDRTDETKPHINMSAYFAYTQALGAAGVARGGAGLQLPHTATVVKIKDGKRHIQDGPFSDSKEQLGGFFIIEAANMDEAIAWAAKCPAAQNAGVEIRPLLPPPPM